MTYTNQMRIICLLQFIEKVLTSLTELDFGQTFEFDVFGFVHQVAHDISFEEEIGQVIPNAKADSQNQGFGNCLFPVESEVVITLGDLSHLLYSHFLLCLYEI